MPEPAETDSRNGKNGKKPQVRGADGRFQKGGGPGPGRPPGLTDASAPTDAAIQDFIERAKLFFNGAEYWTGVCARILAGEAAHVESYLLPRIFGKPKETTAIEGGGLGFQIVLTGPRHDPLADRERAEMPAEPPAPPATPTPPPLLTAQRKAARGPRTAGPRPR